MFKIFGPLHIFKIINSVGTYKCIVNLKIIYTINKIKERILSNIYLRSKNLSKMSYYNL